MRIRPLRGRGIPSFLMLVVVAEVAGRSLTRRVDAGFHVAPLAPSGATYYPFLLVGIKVLAALGLAGLLARFVRAHATARAGQRLLDRVGDRSDRRAPRWHVRLAPRVWLVSFGLTSLAYLLQADAEGVAAGRWPLFAPWLHTYALPVFAALSVLVALAWGFGHWLRAVEEYGVHAIATARRLLVAAARPAAPRRRPADDRTPRRRFGLAFESRPPPVLG
jgi:hypothetical protein